MSNLSVRILSSLVGIPLLLAVLWLGDWVMLLVVVALGLQSERELRQFYGAKSVPFARTWVQSFVVIVPVSLYFSRMDFLTLLGLILILWYAVLLLREIFSPRPRVLAALGAAFHTGLLCTLPFSSLLALDMLLRPAGVSFRWLLLMLVCIWAADSFAYFGGRLFGRHKLLERVSPKKTVEGLLAGLAGALAVALLVTWRIDAPQWPAALVLGLLAGLLGPAGDLLESRLKRDAELKDSGALIPGHGGVLDRFDSWLLVLPVFYLLVRLGWLPLA
ncbi:MAG: phosphatidate cytidylyltransferase [Calditrichaeota bacterium]|nr:phosphatidate cytidylyltransferase [Candidatus Cloacimonadota bacterium]MCA9786146.1 phosphatidate cytidylyltransferase [Candidatus Cloacimonadota bacterium]MCB1047836.1 phosphatidate cytidylyltransferase [Calditrichota bacterium]